MNIAKAKERFWVAMCVGGPVAKSPLVEFVLGLFEQEEEEKDEKESS